MSSDFSDINKILAEYRDVVYEDMQKAIDETTKETVKALRAVNVADAGVYGSWSKYLRGWTSKKDARKSKGHKYQKVVYNKDKYRLAHLLENGTKSHAMPQGGRHPGSRSFSHIAEIDKKASENLIKRLQSKL